MNMSARTFRSAALAVGVFAVCQSVQPYAKAADENRITTKQEFTEALVGRKTSNQYGWAMLHEDASITGEFGDKELTGTGAWEGEYLCRAGKLGKKKIPRDCRVVIVSGTKSVFQSRNEPERRVRDRGWGSDNGVVVGGGMMGWRLRRGQAKPSAPYWFPVDDL